MRKNLKQLIESYDPDADINDLPIFYNCDKAYLFWIVDNDQPKWILFNAIGNVESGSFISG